MKITGEIILKRARGNDLFIVASPIGIQWKGEGFTVPVGAVVNGASIPWIIRWLLPRWHHDYDMASIVHDFAVGEHGRKPAMKWKEAAELFTDIMRHQGAPEWKARLFRFFVLRYRYVKGFIL